MGFMCINTTGSKVIFSALEYLLKKARELFGIDGECELLARNFKLGHAKVIAKGL